MNVSEIKALTNYEAPTATKDQVTKLSSSLIPLTPVSSDEAVLVQFTDSPFSLAKFEKHLQDDARGQGYLSKDGYSYTQRRQTEALGTFADLSFDSFNAATTFLSGQTSYSNRARAIEGLRMTAVTSSQLKSLANQLKGVSRNT